MDYKDQSAGNLQFSLLNGWPPTDQFKILATGQLQQGNIMLQAAIVGASHYVFFDIDGVRFAEVLVGCDITSGNARFIIQQTGDMKFTRNLNEWWCYSFTRQTFDLNNAAAQNEFMEDQLMVEETFLSLHYEFPHEGSGKTPKTEIEVCIIKNFCVEARTTHSYPNEGKVVLTKTRIMKMRGE